MAGTSQYHIIRASALYDVVATIGFAPPFAAATLLMLRNLDTNFNVLGGIPSFENAQLFFANILGIIAGLGGSAHCQTMLGVSQLILGFAIVEAGWLLLQVAAYCAYRRQHSA